MLPSTRPTATIAELREGIELVSKVIVAMSATAYAVGLVIVSEHAATVGLVDIGLIQSHYVLAGVAWLVLTASGSTVWLTIMYCIHMVRRKIALRQYLGILVSLMIPLGAVLSTTTIVSLLRDNVEGFKYTSTWRITLVACGQVLPVAYVFFGWELWRAWFRDVPLTKWWPLVALVAFLGTTILLANSLASYAHRVYPLLSSAYGGGRPIRAMIIFRGDGGPGHRISEDLTGAVNCEIVMETGDWIALRNVGGKNVIPSMRVHKSDVLAILRK